MGKPVPKTIHLQDDNVVVSEISGDVCEEFIVVFDESDKLFQIFYLKLSGEYHRFHLDAGLLFWSSQYPPDEDDDLDEHSSYIDLGERFHLIGSAVEDVRAHDVKGVPFEKLRVEMKFSNGVHLKFESPDLDGGARLIEIHGHDLQP